MPATHRVVVLVHEVGDGGTGPRVSNPATRRLYPCAAPCQRAERAASTAANTHGLTIVSSAARFAGDPPSRIRERHHLRHAAVLANGAQLFIVEIPRHVATPVLECDADDGERESAAPASCSP